MDSGSRHSLDRRVQRTTGSAGGHRCKEATGAKFESSPVEIMSPQKLRYISLWLVFSGVLWSSPFQALGQERFTNSGATVVRRAGVENSPHERTLRLPAVEPEFTAPSAVESQANPGIVDGLSTAAVSAPIRQSKLAATTLPGEPAVVALTTQLVVHNEGKIQAVLQPGTPLHSNKGPAGIDDAPRRRKECLFVTHAIIADDSNGEGASNSDKDTQNSNARPHLTSSENNVSTSCTVFDTCRPTLGSPPVFGAFPIAASGDMSAIKLTRECNSRVSLHRDSDGLRAPGESPQPPDRFVPASQPSEQQGEDYYQKQRQNKHELLRQSLHTGKKPESERDEKPSSCLHIYGKPSVETDVDDFHSNSVQVGGSPLCRVYTVPQRAQPVRSLATEAAYGFSSVPVETEMNAYHRVASAVENTEVPEVEKEALALLSGVRGRHSGTRQWRHTGAALAVPGRFPYYYSTLTPQQMQMLAGQQHFQPHPSAQYVRQHQLPTVTQETGALQQHQHQSPAPLVHQYQQQQPQYYQGAMIPPLYIGPHQTSSGTGGRFREGRRFSRDHLSLRQRQWLQRQQLQQLFQQQQQPHLLQQRYMNTVTPFGAYVGNAAFHPIASSATVVPGLTNPHVRADEYPAVSTISGGHTPSLSDPNLLPLQYRQQNAEGMRLEAQLRNQHDAWRARERSSV